MKNIITILVFFCLLFPETSKSNVDKNFMSSSSKQGKNFLSHRTNDLSKTNILNVKFRSQCLDTYLNFVTALDNSNNMSLQNCRNTFANDVDGWIECNQFSMDVYLLMHAVADAAYDRCVN